MWNSNVGWRFREPWLLEGSVEQWKYQWRPGDLAIMHFCLVLIFNFLLGVTLRVCSTCVELFEGVLFLSKLCYLIVDKLDLV